MTTTNLNSETWPYWGRWCGLDLSDCDPSVLSDREAIENYIVRLCQLLGFKRFGPATIVRFGERPEIAGYSFTQMIETSLISGHLVDASCSAFIDIFSCCEYSVETAQHFTCEFFSARHCVIHVIDRRGR